MRFGTLRRAILGPECSYRVEGLGEAMALIGRLIPLRGPRAARYPVAMARISPILVPPARGMAFLGCINQLICSCRMAFLGCKNQLICP